jgi:putative flippase GtrA
MRTQVRLKNKDSALEFIRYLLVGGFNTVFGYALFAALNWVFAGLGSYGYLYAAIVANPLSITVAFLGYKWFVFRTRGNYLAEWIRCSSVYGTTMLIGLVGLSILVPILRRLLAHPVQAPYIAAAILTVITVLGSFLGHRSFSFRKEQQ